MVDIQAAQDGLNGIVAAVWEVAQGKAEKSSFPLRIVDDPATVKTILSQPNRFAKNYEFIKAFAHGRFTANADDWASRLPITQPSYAKNCYLAAERDAKNVYASAFAALAGQSADGVGRAAIEAAVRIVSHAFGLIEPIPWETAWNEGVRDALTMRQWIGFAGTSQSALHALDERLAALRSECEERWGRADKVQKLLSELADRGRAVPDFDPLEELIQNLLASTETTAASILWAVAAMAKQSDLASHLREGTCTPENFIAELLRLYPPVPFVTRYAVDAQTAGNESFAAGEPFLISILGMHYNNRFWQDVRRFNPDRFRSGKSAYRDHYMPFLSGPRACGGRRLAELELTSAVSVLSEIYDFHLEPGHEVLFDYGLSLRPRLTGLRIQVRQDGV